ncbi:MAG TPA: YraN family protein [Vicinamibacterales bacterium]|jgi:putative endonuclease|nr:YraN family protein [Vicinamibacterales bacterium]
MSRVRVAFGKIGEDLACEELVRRGYEILARRYRQRGGEIDIVARDGLTLVFVEVKSRGGRAFGDGSEAVTPRKQRTIAALALDYMARHKVHECPCRFDVVSVLLENGQTTVEVVRDAFSACA